MFSFKMSQRFASFIIGWAIPLSPYIFWFKSNIQRYEICLNLTTTLFEGYSSMQQEFIEHQFSCSTSRLMKNKYFFRMRAHLFGPTSMLLWWFLYGACCVCTWRGRLCHRLFCLIFSVLESSALPQRIWRKQAEA